MAEIERQAGREYPLVSLELFFIGNDDEGSIGPNLVPHPGIPAFAAVLLAIRNRPEVADVWVGIGEVAWPDEWPFSDHVYVITSAARAEVGRWAAALDPDEPTLGWLSEDLLPVPVPEGMHPVCLWWD